MWRRSRLARRRGRRRDRNALIPLAPLLMGASSGPSSCNGKGSSSSSSTSTKVLIAGGEDSSGAILDDAELYDPAAGTFAALAKTMSDGRAFQTATLLNDGHVLIPGGVNNGGTVIDS